MIQAENTGVAHSADSSKKSSSAPPKIRLTFLDGMRGLAALYLVSYHAFRLEGDPEPTGEGGLANLVMHAYNSIKYALFTYGHFALVVFIIISGFSLMLPVARAGTGRFQNGTLDFIMRRVFRIIPPYYTALAISLVLIALIPGLNQQSGGWWDAALPAFTPEAIISHLFMVHNFGPWASAINIPVWTIATLFQIYLMFALVLLPLWRRIGSLATIAVAFGIGLVGQLIFARDINVNQPWFFPWYLGIFAMGMFGAEISFSQKPWMKTWLNRIPWRGIAIGCALVVVFLVTLTKKFWERRFGIDFQVEPEQVIWLKDLLVATATMCIAIYFTRQVTTGADTKRNFIMRRLGTPPISKLGNLSFSIYLTHGPTIALLDLTCRTLQLPLLAICLIDVLVGLPLALLVCYTFHRQIERRLSKLSWQNISQYWKNRQAADVDPASR